MTHTSTEQPEALRLADLALKNKRGILSFSERAEIAIRLRRQHARIEVLEAAKAQRVPLSVEAIAEIAERFEVPNPTDSFWVELCRAFEGASVSGITQEKQ